MRQFQKRAEETSSAMPIQPVTALVRDTMRKPARFTTAAGEVQSCCVNCDEKPCISFSPPEVPTNAPPHALRVCPTDAIHYSNAERRVSVTDACVGCGLCVLRCPYGALFVDGKKANALPLDLAAYRSSTPAEAKTLLKAPKTVAISTPEIRTTIKNSITLQGQTDKYAFYPLVGSLLTAAGLYTVVSRAGDTNNRMDAVVIDAVESMPAEIKSPGEVLYVNAKAVRQAVENKIVMTARSMFPTKPETSTLAIGYSYANDRSDVEELVEDVFATFSIKVGLVSLEALYALVWRRYARGEKDVALVLRKLKGRADATIP